MDVPIKDVREGDRFVDETGGGWTALADARQVEDNGVPAVCVEVQYQPDGGRGERLWHPKTTIAITREG